MAKEMILLKLTEKEIPVVLEALHFFARELADMIKQYDDEETASESQQLEVIDQIIDVIQLTLKKSSC